LGPLEFIHPFDKKSKGNNTLVTRLKVIGYNKWCASVKNTIAFAQSARFDYVELGSLN